MRDQGARADVCVCLFVCLCVSESTRSRENERPVTKTSDEDDEEEAAMFARTIHPNHPWSTHLKKSEGKGREVHHPLHLLRRKKTKKNKNTKAKREHICIMPAIIGLLKMVRSSPPQQPMVK